MFILNNITMESENKYICGYCGEFVDKVTYNEDKDIDECDDCID